MSDKSDRRGGGERRSGHDRRKQPSRVTRANSAPALAGVAGTMTSYLAALIAEKYKIPVEVTAPVVGVVLGVLAALYNKFVLPWMR